MCQLGTGKAPVGGLGTCLQKLKLFFINECLNFSVLEKIVSAEGWGQVQGLPQYAPDFENTVIALKRFGFLVPG